MRGERNGCRNPTPVPASSPENFRGKEFLTRVLELWREIIK